MFYFKSRLNVHYASVFNTGSATQRPNTQYIRVWIDVIFGGVENSYNMTKIYIQNS